MQRPSRIALVWLGSAGCIVHVDPCDTHVECASDELCWDGTCEPAMERAWTVEIAAAEVGAMHPDGNEWDPALGAPDLYAEFGLPWDACITSLLPDMFDPVWYESCDFYIPYGADFFVNLWDADGAVDELGAGYTWDGIDGFVSLARTAGQESGYVDESGTVLLWMTVWPW